MSLDSLKSYMSQCNLPIDREIYPDGKIHRYSSRGTSNISEWYVCQEIEDGRLFCTFASWRDMEKKYVWRSYESVDIEREKELLNSMKEQYEIEHAKVVKEAKKEIVYRWENSLPSLEHPYFQKKGISPIDLKEAEGKLIIPLFSMDKELSSLLYINSQGEKRYHSGLSTKGIFHPFGNYEDSKEIIFCEGYATGYSIFISTMIPTISCGSCSNVCIVAQMFKSHFPQKSLILAIDKDQAGFKTKEQWLGIINENVVVPVTDKDNVDFNDLYQVLGKDAIKNMFIPERIVSESMDDFLKRDIPKDTWYNRILQKGSFNIFYGAGGVGKSRFAYELALCLSQGFNFIGYTTFMKAKVLYIDGEMKPSEIKERCENMRIQYNIPEFGDSFSLSHNLMIRAQLGDPLDLFNDSHRRKLEPLFNDYDIIFLDNFGCLTTSQGGESFKSDKVQWQKMFSWLNLMISKGKTFVMIQHETKDGKQEGVAKIRNDADLVLQIKQPTDLDINCLAHLEIRFDKARAIPLKDQVRRKIKKLKDSEPWISI